MSWAAVIAGAGAVIGGVIQSQGAKKAGNAAASGDAAAIAEQQRQFDLTRSDLAPYRAIGGQALNALGSIYGYQPAANYFGQSAPASSAPANPQMPKNNLGKNSALALVGGGGLGTVLGVSGLLQGGLGGGHSGSHWRNWDAFNAAFPGTKVDAQGNYVLPAQFGNAVVNQQQLDNLAGTWFGATYAPDGNQAGWQSQYQNVLAQVAPNANAGAGSAATQYSDGVPNPSPLQTGPAGPAGAATNPLAAPDYSAFFMSPDYQFRKSQGMQGIENQFSATGGAKSGNALKALADFNSSLAGNEFGNYFNRQALLAGIGQTATNTGVQAGQQTAANIGNALIGQGNARASGVAGQYDAYGNALNGLGYAAGNYFGRRQPSMGSPYYGYSGVPA